MRFEATLNGRDALLSWQTASETNTAGFEIQWSDREGAKGEERMWQTLAFVEGSGTTEQPQTYRYRIEDLVPGPHTFRLKQIDFDGTFEYSAEVEIVVDLTHAFVLTQPYPNPFNSKVSFSLMVKRRQAVTVAVYDVLGRQRRVLFQGEMAAEQAQVIKFEAGYLPSGLYLIQAVGETFIATRSVALAR